MSAVGKTKDVGWEIGVSRTVPRGSDDVWQLLTSAKGVRTWLGAGVRFPLDKGDAYETAEGVTGEIRSYRVGDRIRLTWRPPDWTHDSTVQVAISRGAKGTVVRFHQERLASAAEREQQREHWRNVLDELLG
jgi:uncharacterized protein YndB with AHSA1/START domain